MRSSRLKIQFLSFDLSICRLVPESGLPQWSEQSGFLSVVKTEEELSIVCESILVPKNPRFAVEPGWIAIKVIGPLDFSEIGILSAISSTLAKKRISIFAISSFNTDYLLIKRESRDAAREVLSSHFDVRP